MTDIKTIAADIAQEFRERLSTDSGEFFKALYKHSGKEADAAIVAFWDELASMDGSMSIGAWFGTGRTVADVIALCERVATAQRHGEGQP